MIFGPPWRGGVNELIVEMRNLLCGFLFKAKKPRTSFTPPLQVGPNIIQQNREREIGRETERERKIECDFFFE